ncbi:MAG TPA: hypothetical protein P5175_06175 [Anaerohalosphaeraceae bacterium]|nr:hypothetical protein [Anaerohalosphaeraceae bacterium]
MVDFKNAGKNIDRGSNSQRGKSKFIFIASVLFLLGAVGIWTFKEYGSQETQEHATSGTSNGPEDSKPPLSQTDVTVAPSESSPEKDSVEEKTAELSRLAHKAAEIGDYEKAISLCDQILNQYPQSQSYNAVLLQKEKWSDEVEQKKLEKQVELILAEAKRLKSEGRLEDSLKSVKELLKLDLDNAAGKQLEIDLMAQVEQQENEKKIDALLTQAKNASQDGRHIDALKYVNDALKIDKNDAEAFQLHTQLVAVVEDEELQLENQKIIADLIKQAAGYESQNKWIAASETYSKILKIEPENKNIQEALLNCKHKHHVSMAQEFLSKDDISSAILHYTEALELLENENTRLEMQKTQALLQKRKEAQYLKDLLAKAQVSEGSGKLEEAIDFYQKAEMIQHDKDISNKINELKEKVSEEQRKSEFMRLLTAARTKTSQNVAEEALELIDEALTIYPDNEDSLDLKLEILSHMPIPKEVTLSKTLKGHKGFINSAGFSPDGQYIVSGSSDNSVKIWDTKSGKCIKTLEGHKHSVTAVVFSPDSKLIASGDSWGHTLKIWDIKSGRCIHSTEVHGRDIHDLSFSPDSQYVVTAAGDKLIKIWRVDTLENIKTLSGHKNGVFAVEFMPDGNKLVSGSWDKTVKIWDINSGKCLKTLEGHSGTVEDVSVSPDGKLIVSCEFWGGKIVVWDAIKGVELHRIPSSFWGYRSVTFSPYGNYFIAGDSDGKLFMFDTHTGKFALEKKAHSAFPNYIESIAFSPDGRSFLSAGYDNSIKVWSVK